MMDDGLSGDQNTASGQAAAGELSHSFLAVLLHRHCAERIAVSFRCLSSSIATSKAG
jgi:hypothetical protein